MKNNTTLSPLLAGYIPVAEMLVATFGADCEVVLHDLSKPEHSVVYVANGRVTGRQVGQSFDHLIKEVIYSDKLKQDFVANYYFNTTDGRLIRSSSLLIRDAEGQLAGALCINLDTSVVTGQIAYLQSLLPNLPTVSAAPSTPAPTESGHVTDMIDDLISAILGDPAPTSLSREEKIEKIRFMDAKGIFLMKGSVEKVAERLNVNKVTVYSYLDEARGKR